jgi:adenosylhomocysteinase
MKPDIIIDDGGDLVRLLHSEEALGAEKVLGGCEETTTGVQRLKALAREGRLLFPMFAVNDAKMKYLFDNRYGTGQSVWDGIMRTTNLSVAGKTVAVVGYGWCGKGIAMRADGLGASVIVVEVDPVKAIEAVMDGYQVKKAIQAARESDFLITATGSIDALDKKAIGNLKDGALLANAGHFDVEISKKALKKLSVKEREVRNNIREYQLEDGRLVYLLSDGRLVNLAAGDGHPVEIMDTSFALQLLTAKYLLENRKNLKPDLYPVPIEVDREVAELKLRSLGIEIDQLTEKQQEYLASWKQI